LVGAAEIVPRFANYLLCVAIVATLAGGLGGSIQPARVVVALAVVLVLIRASTSLLTPPVTRQALTMSVVMILGGALSLFWTEDVLGGLGLLLAVSIGALSLFLVTRADLSEGGVRLLLWAWAMAVGLSLPIALYEIGTGNHFQFALDDRTIRGVGVFPFASIFFGNYNDFSAWLCMGFTMTMAAFLEAKTAIRKIMITVVNIFVALVIFVNTSRGAIIYVSLVTLFYSIRFVDFRRYAGSMVALISPVILGLFYDRLVEIYNLALIRFEYVDYAEESFGQRADLIAAGIRAILESYGLGIGIGGFEEYLGQRYYGLIPNPHNIITEIGVNFGFIPMLLFVGLLVRLFSVGLFRRDMPEAFRTALLCGAIGVPIIGVVPSQAIGFIYWWVWLATLVAIASTRRSDVAEEAVEHANWKQRDSAARAVSR
jgi:hypothetical protein